MKPSLTLITALLLAPLAAYAQNDEPRDLTKPEVEIATKGAKRAWEFAPAEKKAQWQQHLEALKHIDFFDDTKRQTVIARGSPEPGEYHAHPTTAMLADNKTMFCVWNIGHGGHAGPMARSVDAGLNWTRMDDALPPNYANFKNCPSIYRITDPQGKERLWVFAARTLTEQENPKPIEGRHQGFMPRIVSEDDGKTWRELPPIGGRIAKDDPFRCIMTFSSVVQLKDGSSLGLFHRGSGIGEEGTLQVLQSITRDGGFTWSPPVVVCDGTKLDGKHPCEPYAFRSPDGGELCCLMRENKRSGTSLVMFSRDEGKTWSQAVDAPWGLTGDRHHGIRLPDGRLVIVFRNASPNAKDKGFIAWVGTYEDIKSGKPGQYRVSLLKTFKDGFYPGIHLLPDGTIVATTYANLIATENPSIVSVRFKMCEVDALAKKNPLTSNDAAPMRNPDQSAGIDPDDGTAPRPDKAIPPKLIANPDSTADYNRAKRTCTGVPSIAVSRGGRLWAAWFSGTTPGEIIERCPNAYVVVSTSGDGGKTWKEVLAIDPDGPGPLKAYDPHPWIDPQGRLWVFFTLLYPLHKHAWAITAESGDQASPAWSPPRPVFEGVLLNKPTVLANGDWLFPTYARRPQNMGAVLSHVSRDKGRSFTVKGQIEASWDLFPSEPMTVERKDGSLWMLVRTTKGIGESVSADGGATWSPLKIPAIQHTASRFFIGRLQSGNLLLVKHLGIGDDPLSAGKAKQRRELTAIVSKDDGKSWSGGLVLDERVGCSYPDAQQSADGTIYICWDYQRSREQELWMTTFREEDLLTANKEAAARVNSNRHIISRGGTPE